MSNDFGVLEILLNIFGSLVIGVGLFVIIIVRVVCVLIKWGSCWVLLVSGKIFKLIFGRFILFDVKVIW